MMNFRVLMYCPDRHIQYDGRTPDEIGVGGGITARVRMSRALARLGHEVIHVGNCPRREVTDGVHYVPLDSFEGADVDVAVLTTSGDGLDLTPAVEAGIRATRTIIWVHGVDKPRGLDELAFDAVYAVSEFIAGIVREEWGIPGHKIVVTYNGYEPAHYGGRPEVERDPYRLIYFSHPSKGLEPALGVLEHLRARDPRFHLVICGGERLWGGEERDRELPEGAQYLGMLGQRDLAVELMRSSFALQLQRRQEPGALAIPDAQRAGCVIVASPVGVYPELVSGEMGGMLTEDDAWSVDAQSNTADRIIELVGDEGSLAFMRQRAVHAARSSNATAQRWMALWERLSSPSVLRT